MRAAVALTLLLTSVAAFSHEARRDHRSCSPSLPLALSKLRGGVAYGSGPSYSTEAMAPAMSSSSSRSRSSDMSDAERVHVLHDTDTGRGQLWPGRADQLALYRNATRLAIEATERARARDRRRRAVLPALDDQGDDLDEPLAHRAVDRQPVLREARRLAVAALAL